MTLYTPSTPIDSAIMFGHWELLIVFLLILIVFGAGKLPSVFSSLGEGVKNFKKSMKDEDTTPNEAGQAKVEGEAKQQIEEKQSPTIEALKSDEPEKEPVKSDSQNS